MSNSVRPHRRKPTRLPRPWDSPGKNTGVGLVSWPETKSMPPTLKEQSPNHGTSREVPQTQLLTGKFGTNRKVYRHPHSQDPSNPLLWVPRAPQTNSIIRGPSTEYYGDWIDLPHLCHDPERRPMKSSLGIEARSSSHLDGLIPRVRALTTVQCWPAVSPGHQDSESKENSTVQGPLDKSII